VSNVTIVEAQNGVRHWVATAFGKEAADDVTERNHRFLEEALELVQSAGCTKYEAVQLVDYVYNRPAGEVAQEAGGTLSTLMALCSAHQLSLADCFLTEHMRCWNDIEQIRTKQAAKPKMRP
jgi:hypothetical protein